MLADMGRFEQHLEQALPEYFAAPVDGRAIGDRQPVAQPTPRSVELVSSRSPDVTTI